MVSIITERAYQNWPSWDVVYEWEDQLSKELNIPIKNMYSCCGNIRKKIRKIKRKLNIAQSRFHVENKKDIKLVWIMDAKILKEYTYQNFVPIFLDFSVESVEEVIEATRNLPFFWVTSKGIFDVLVSKGVNNVHFIPLSISDKYYVKKVPQKSIDVIQFGRKNKVLHEYMLNYAKTNSHVEYVYQSEDGSLTYTSTTRGNIGKFDNRQEYMELMSKCRVSLVSSPAVDKGKNFGGVDFITPRFYESAVHYCHMIGRYTDNEEAEIIKLGDICKNIHNQEEFDNCLNSMLKEENNVVFDAYNQFLEKNVTSKRAEEMKSVLKSC